MGTYDDMWKGTHETIRAGFWGLYLEHDIGRITVKEVCARSGCNRSTFYRHYPDVYAVLEEIEGELLGRAKALRPSQLTVGSDLDDFLRRLYELYDADRAFLHVLVGQRRDPAFSETYRAALRGKVPLIFTFESGGVMTPEGPAGTSEEVRAALDILCAMFIDLFVAWADDPCLPYDRLQDILRGLTVDGLSHTLLRLYHVRAMFERPGAEGDA